MMKLSTLMVTLIAIVAGCASCTNMPGADGRYATHNRGAGNMEGGRGLPSTPYVPR